MNKESDVQVQKQFTVVMRGSASVVFWENENLRLSQVPTTNHTKVDITYCTRWLELGENIRIPGHLWIEVVGTGETLEKVMVPFANAALIALPILSLTSNATILEPEIELGFDSTPGVRQREYFQSYLPAESGTTYVGRHVNCQATAAVLTAITNDSDSERLLRATNQYRLALESWKMGRESMSLAHLWMALEAITKVKIRKECSRLGFKNEQELANSLNVELRHLDPTIRKILLHNDEECYKKSKAASDGFEHGFLGYDTMREYAKDVRHRMAAYIRNAVLSLSNVPENVLPILLNDPFDKPLGHWPLAKYIRGHLVGDSSALARNGNAYPYLRWNPSIRSCVPDSGGQLKMQFSESFTAELADGISFQPQSVEVWRPD